MLITELSQLDKFLLMLRVEVCFLHFSLVSHRCHSILSYHGNDLIVVLHNPRSFQYYLYEISNSQIHRFHG